MVDGLTTPFDFLLTKLDLTSQSQTMDLRLIFVELNLFQDIFANVMSGNLIITDSTNILGHVGVDDEIFLHIVLDKPGLNAPIDHKFHIYNSVVTQINPNNQTVRLNFCSEDLLVSKSLVTSKLYNNMLISDMVKDLGKTLMKIETLPDENIEITTGINKFTIPGLNPFQAINWLASKSTSSYVGASYLFYENPKGFNFKSLQKLMDVSNPVAIYNFNVKNIGGNDTNVNFFDASIYELIATPDTLSGLVNGTNSGRLITLDLLRQKYTISNLNADDLFNASTKLASGKPYTGFKNRVDNQPADSYAGYTKFYVTNLDQDKAAYIKGKQQINQTNVEQWLLERNAQMMQFLSNRIKLVVPGNTALKIGDVIKFNMPSTEPQTGANEGDTKRILDPQNQGMYVITAVRHRVDIRMFETVLEICRNSVYQV